MEESDELYLLRYRYGRTAETFVAYETFLHREVHSGPGKRCHDQDVVKNVTHTLLVTFYSFIYSLFDKSGTDFITTTEPYKGILTDDGKKFRNELIDMWNENKAAISKLRHNVGFHGGTKLKSHEVGYAAFSEVHPQTPELIMAFFALFLIELDKVVPPSEKKSDVDPDKMKRFMLEHSERLKKKLGDPYWQALKKFMDDFNNFV